MLYPLEKVAKPYFYFLYGVITMILLEKKACISVGQNNKSSDEILSIFQQMPVETKSITGFEIATFVMQVIDLIATVVSIPVLAEAINKGHICVTIDGYKINDSVSHIIKGIQSDPDLLKMAEQAYTDNTLSVEGNTKSNIQFRKKLQTLIDSKNESKGENNG